MIGGMTEKAHVPAGTEWKSLSASISLPRSYFVSIMKRRGMLAEPKDQKEEDKFVTEVINPEIEEGGSWPRTRSGRRRTIRFRWCGMTTW